VTLDQQIMTAMEPGRRYEVTRLGAALGSDYSKTFFALSRLRGFGYVEEHEGNEYSLTKVGEGLHEILSSSS
jgi:DNA-binding IclR family transcriptional regulator